MVCLVSLRLFEVLRPKDPSRLTTRLAYGLLLEGLSWLSQNM